MFTAKRSIFLTAISLGSLLLLLTSCAPPGDTGKQLDELQAKVDAIEAELQQLNREVAALKEAPDRSARRGPDRAARAQAPDRTFESTQLTVGQSSVLGSDSAPVTMFAYNDYTCTECGPFATEVLPEIVSRYVESGSLRIVMRELPNRQGGRNALQQSRIAICAGQQGRYLEILEVFYTNTMSSREEILERVKQLNLDQDRFKSCVKDSQTADQIRAHVREADEAAVQGAPGFLLGLTDQDNPGSVMVTRNLGGPPQLAEIQAAIDELLEQADASN
jgi:protein-disulfide isomerase